MRQEGTGAKFLARLGMSGERTFRIQVQAGICQLKAAAGVRQWWRARFGN